MMHVPINEIIKSKVPFTFDVKEMVGKNLFDH